MKTHGVDPGRSSLRALICPTLVTRCLEAVLGSLRQDAISIVRAATKSQFELIEGSVTSLRISTSDGEVVFQGLQGLDVVHISTSNRSQHLDGTCELAQHLARYAIRSLEGHQGLIKERCLSRLTSDSCTDLLEFKYSKLLADSETRKMYHYFDRENGTIRVPEGTFSLSSESFYLKNCPQVPAYLPPPKLEVASAKATFSDSRIGAMLRFLGSEKGAEVAKLSTAETQALLKWARAKNQEAGEYGDLPISSQITAGVKS